jgi:hypothetical protein
MVHPLSKKRKNNNSLVKDWQFYPGIHKYPPRRAQLWRVGYIHGFYGTDIC